MPSALTGSALGTSRGGNSNARLPGDDFSKISPSLWFVCRDAFLIFSFMSPICLAARGVLHSCDGCDSLDGPLERPFQRSCKSFNLRAWCRLRDAYQRMLRQFRIRRAQRQWADNSFAQKLRVDHLHRARQFDREFIEEWRVERAPDAGNLQQFRQRELRFREVLLRHLAQAFLAEKRQVDGGRQRAKRLVRANVRGGFLTANVLLARRQRQHKTAPAVRICRLARKPPGHLAHKLVSRSDYSGKRPAITRRQSKALAFHRHDVRFRRRPKQSERNAFRYGDHEHRTGS